MKLDQAIARAQYRAKKTGTDRLVVASRVFSDHYFVCTKEETKTSFKGAQVVYRIDCRRRPIEP